MKDLTFEYNETAKKDALLREELAGLRQNFDREALIYASDPVRFLNAPLVTDRETYRRL